MWSFRYVDRRKLFRAEVDTGVGIAFRADNTRGSTATCRRHFGLGIRSPEYSKGTSPYNNGKYISLWNTMPSVTSKSKTHIFWNKGQSQNQKVIDFGVIWKGIISWICMPNMKSPFLTIQKL